MKKNKPQSDGCQVEYPQEFDERYEIVNET
jgi:hypothetical protein